MATHEAYKDVNKEQFHEIPGQSARQRITPVKRQKVLMNDDPRFRLTTRPRTKEDDDDN